MREIKFRGQRIASSEWEYGSLYINEKGEAFIDKQEWKREPVKPETVGEYTGLHDTKGKEVYEGDIVQVYYNDKIKGGKAIIKYLDRSFCMTQEENDTELDCVWFNICEVIGNVYENPELLKK